MPQLRQPGFLRQLQHLQKQPPQRRQMTLPEVGDRAEIRRIVRHDHHEIDPLGAGLRDPPRGITTRAIGIEQQGRHQARIEWRLTKPAFIACDDLRQVQVLARQGDDELRQMVRRHIIGNRWRQELRLINLPRSKMPAHVAKGIRFAAKTPPLLGQAPSSLIDKYIRFSARVGAGDGDWQDGGWIDLTDSERRELESLASRRKTAQGLAQRARIVLHAAAGVANKDISLRLGAAPNTVGKWRPAGSPNIGWRVFMTSPVRARRARSAMTRSPRSFARRSRRRRRMRRTGACARWRKQPASRLRRSTASGGLSTSSLTAPKPSSSQPILCSSRRCAISSGFICRRRRLFFG